MDILSKFIRDQLSVWPLAAANFRALKSMHVRPVTINGIKSEIQYNPSRITSSTARIDDEYLAARPCFLCVVFVCIADLLQVLFVFLRQV